MFGSEDDGRPDEFELTNVGETEESAFPKIANYRIQQRIGEGGMGEVFEADQLKPVRRRVALKVVKHGMDSRQVVARFDSERQALAVMNHPNISRVFDAGTTQNGRPYFAMEYVKGVPITVYCDRYRLSVRQRLELFIQICEGLQHAHQKGIIHRDIKPSNVLVKVEGDQPVPKIIDFGISKATEHRLTDQTAFTELGQLIGTPEYMSPEQAEMTAQDIDTRTDVYSLGVLLYELLVGSLPFEHKDLREHGFDEFRRRIREDEPARPSARLTALGAAADKPAHDRRSDPSALKKMVQGDLDWITLKALEKDRTRRYGSPMDMAADIKRHQENLPVQARPPSTSYRLGKFVKRHKVGVGSGAVLLLLLIAFATAMAFLAARLTRERDRATREEENATRLAQVLDELFDLSNPGTALGNSITVRELLDHGLERVRASLADQPETLAQYLTKIGDYYRELGLYEKGEPLLLEARKLRSESLGPEHPHTLESMSALAHLYKDQGRYPEAEALVDETLQVQRSKLGRNHQATLASMNLLAGLYRNATRYAEAEELFIDTLQRRKQHLGERNPDTAETMNDLGLLYAENLKREAEAEELYDGALEVYREVLSNEHPRTLHTMNNLALLYDHQDRDDEAEALYLEVSATMKRVLGRDHPNTLTAMNNLAGLYEADARFTEAEPLYVEVLAGLRKSVGNDNPGTLGALGNLGQLYTRTGRPTAAEPLLLEAVEGTRRVLGSHPYTGVSLRKYGDCMTVMQRYDEAEPALIEAYEILAQTMSADHEQTLKTVRNLVELYEAWGKPAKTAEWLEKLRASE